MEDEGVFWTDSQGAITKTPLITQNSSSMLNLQVPELEPGNYIIAISTRLGNHKLRTTETETTVKIT